MIFRSRLALFASMLFVSGGALLLACSDDDGDATADPTPDASTYEDARGPSPDPDPDPDPEDGGDAGDAGKEPDRCTGKYEPPVIKSDGPCGSMKDFGAPAAPFGPVDEDAGGEYDKGTELAPGVYDAVMAERSSKIPGSWRETFVVDGNRFTRLRQLDLTGKGPGAIKYWSGTFEYTADRKIKLTYDCVQEGDKPSNDKKDELPSDAVVSADCEGTLRYGATGIRVTLRRR